MDEKRAQIIDKFFNAGKRLVLTDPVYKQWVMRYTFLELEKDLGENGDITTDCFKLEKRIYKARIYANSKGVMAGGDEIEYFLDKSDPALRPRLGHIKILQKQPDGEEFLKDDLLLEIEGDIHDVLKSERVVLNLLQHMCGVASYTKKLVDKARTVNSKILICPTRKTTWGWLDKKAVTLGGGGTHRLSLSDAVLIKDNHESLFENDFKKLFENFTLPQTEYAFIEIELQDQEKAIENLELLNKLQKERKLPVPLVIMFDNIKPKIIQKLFEQIKKKNFYDFFIYESSGGINEDNITEYASIGVDVISMGSLTQKIQPIDLSLEIGKPS
jgi:nicotinate-nucleotide pyrophosphorylase (carboxylating)